MTGLAYLTLGCRALLVLVFAASLIGKLAGREAVGTFVLATRRLAPVPISTSQARWAATGVVGAEAATVIALLVPGWTIAGFLLASALLAVFSGVLLLALRRGERTPCHCFGSSSQRPLGIAPVLRNAALLVVVALGVGGSAAAVAPSGVTLGGAAITVLAAVVAVVPFILSEELAGLFRTESRPPTTARTRSAPSGPERAETNQ